VTTIDAEALRPGLSGQTPDQLMAWVEARGEPGYRARQVADAIWKDGGVTAAAAIRTLPAALREALEAEFRFDTVSDTDVREADGRADREVPPPSR
jgi:adenine C2-methylase RlmN of 23S rRNA A2503 and tRNA A37